MAKILISRVSAERTGRRLICSGYRPKNGRRLQDVMGDRRTKWVPRTAMYPCTPKADTEEAKRRLFYAPTVNPPFPTVDEHHHVVVFVSLKDLNFGPCGQANRAVLIGFRTLLGQRCKGVRIRPRPACASEGFAGDDPGFCKGGARRRRKHDKRGSQNSANCRLHRRTEPRNSANYQLMSANGSFATGAFRFQLRPMSAVLSKRK